ncbi:MAG: M20/M25/M40 family metallo-hydrolase [Spirochaetia bacterium]|jgi:carboxypeptidase PM20D1|nr:M20/M25/M40 family metallo-hydrolase [Spirochaetia bacterium]
MFLISILSVIIFILLVIAITRTLILTHKKNVAALPSSLPDASQAIEKLQTAITFRTVSSREEDTTDWSQFVQFSTYLAQAFPLCEKHLKRECESEHNLIYCFPGEDTTAIPGLLTAHQDVVSANEEEWTHPPFAKTLQDGYVWGRGSFDCKLQLIAILQAFEHLLQEGKKPKRTWYAAFGCDEEVNGGTRGATLIAEQFERMGLSFSLLLDEGGVVSENYIKGIDRPIAVVGVAEKGYMDTRLSCSREAGHSSTPQMPTALGKIARAVTAIETSRQEARITKPVQAMLKNIGEEAPFPYAFLFLNLWLTKPLVRLIFSRSPTLNALIRTTSVPTMIGASDKSNVIALTATSMVNTRLLTGDTRESTLKHLKTVISDEEVSLTVTRYEKPSQASPTTGEAFDLIKATISQVFPDAIVTSYLMLGATDARKYQNLCQHIYRFTPAQMDKSEVARMHAPDERMHTKNIQKAVAFFLTLLENW